MWLRRRQRNIWVEELGSTEARASDWTRNLKRAYDSPCLLQIEAHFSHVRQTCPRVCPQTLNLMPRIFGTACVMDGFSSDRSILVCSPKPPTLRRTLAFAASCTIGHKLAVALALARAHFRKSPGRVPSVWERHLRRQICADTRLYSSSGLGGKKSSRDMRRRLWCERGVYS